VEVENLYYFGCWEYSEYAVLTMSGSDVVWISMRFFDLIFPLFFLDKKNILLFLVPNDLWICFFLYFFI